MSRKIILTFTVLSLFIFSQTLSLAEESGFHFSNWPLKNFKNRQILFSFGESNHKGIDIDAKIGEEVRAVADGEVYWTFSKKPHGLAVGIDHKNGWRTTYLHLSEKLVKKGQRVKANQVIGKVGVGKVGTGKEKPDFVKPHLHFGLNSDSKAKIWNGKYKNPLIFGPLVKFEQNTTEQKTVNQQEKHLPKISQSQVLQTTVPQTIVTPAKSIALRHLVPQKLLVKFKQNISESSLKKRPTVLFNSYQKKRKRQKNENKIRHKINNEPLEQARLALSSVLAQYKTEVKTKSMVKNVNNLSFYNGFAKGKRSVSSNIIVFYWLLLVGAVYLGSLTNRRRKKILSSIFAT